MHCNAIKIWTIALIFSVSCKTRSAQTNFHSQTHESDPNFRPVAEFVGRLILPDFEQLRQAALTLPPIKDHGSNKDAPALWIDDTVIFELSLDVPSQGLKKGDRVWLTWSPAQRKILEHDAKILSEVSISAELKENMLDPKATPDSPVYGQLNDLRFGREVLPLRLDDFTQKHRTKVGPLMSLAGARPINIEPMVKLVGPVERLATTENTDSNQKATFYIDEHPIMVEGSKMALVKFITAENSDATVWRVKHWGEGDFSGNEEFMSLKPPSQRGSHQLPSYNFQSFAQNMDRESNHLKFLNGERSRELNSEGFYVYGEHENGQFIVYGLTPRALIRADADHLNAWASRDRSKKRRSDQLWKDAFFDIADNHLIGVAATSSDSRTEETSEKTSWWLSVHNGDAASWKIGDQALLAHIFGGIGGPKGDNIMILGQDNQLSPGHFSFGTAEVVEDPITKRPVFDITYHQIYAHSRDGILSGPQSWHVYMGSLTRGWAYSRPVADVLYKANEWNSAIELNLDAGQGQVIRRPMTVLEALTREFDTVAAGYRTGFGQGIAQVSAVTSCSQDSALALNKALIKLAENGYDSALRREASRVFLKRGALFQPIRGDWMQYLKTGQRVSTKGQLRTLIAALGSHNSMTPRETWNELNKLLGNTRTPTILIRTNAIMSSQSEQYPLEPTNVSMLAQHLRRISGQLVQDLIFKDPEP